MFCSVLPFSSHPGPSSVSDHSAVCTKNRKLLDTSFKRLGFLFQKRLTSAFMEDRSKPCTTQRTGRDIGSYTNNPIMSLRCVDIHDDNELKVTTFNYILGPLRQVFTRPHTVIICMV